MGTIRKATTPDSIAGYDKAYWHAKTPLERLDATLALQPPDARLSKEDSDRVVYKFQTATEWPAFKKSRRQH